MSPPPGGSPAGSPKHASSPTARRRALVSRSADWWVPARQRKSNLPRRPPANTDPSAWAPARSQWLFSRAPRRRQEPQANRTRYRDPLARGCQPAVVRVAPEHDYGVGALIGGEQPRPGWIQAEIARPIALRGNHLVEHERARRFRHGEHGDTVAAAVRHIQRPPR